MERLAAEGKKAFEPLRQAADWPAGAASLSTSLQHQTPALQAVKHVRHQLEHAARCADSKVLQNLLEKSQL